jgi:lantibiotic transport system ATP-binding protein
MDYVIEAEHLTGGYGARIVLRDVSVRVSRGSIYGLLGPNGAGKTTLLRMFLGLLRPLRGTIRVFGKQLREAAPKVFERVGSLIEQPSMMIGAPAVWSLSRRDVL